MSYSGRNGDLMVRCTCTYPHRTLSSVTVRIHIICKFTQNPPSAEIETTERIGQTLDCYRRIRNSSLTCVVPVRISAAIVPLLRENLPTTRDTCEQTYRSNASSFASDKLSTLNNGTSCTPKCGFPSPTNHHPRNSAITDKQRGTSQREVFVHCNSYRVPATSLRTVLARGFYD